MAVLILGYGFSAQRFVARVSSSGGAGPITATRRSPEACAALTAQGVEALVFDAAEGASDAVRAAAKTAAIVLVTAPPDEAGCPVHRALGADLAASSRLAWLGYLSTTGVYGDRGGGWAFEEDAPTPGSERARRRVLAERDWLDAIPQAQVFRLPGIYGPGRSQLDRARKGEARRIVRPGLVMNRIHVDDLADLLVRASTGGSETGARAGAPGLRVFNVVDDTPAPPADVTAQACRLVGAAVPQAVSLADSGLTGLALEFYSESKRASNARAKAAFGWRPRFPSYAEGLAAVLAAERDPPSS